MQKSPILIVGLGNPGSEYAQTRHNLGYLVIQAFAEKLGWIFKKESRFKGNIAEGSLGEKKIYLLLPTTYMNLSGDAVRKILDFYHISKEALLVVVDDVYLNFGVLRFRLQGSAGGHNGLKSIEQAIHSQAYHRLRMGIGPLEDLSSQEREFFLKEYVLQVFSKEEREKLPSFVAKGADVIDCWIQQGAEAAMRLTGTFNKREET